ncbi:NAD(P)-dependent dehydrogenase (short-subunit alcohol dehydrogenase family) [Paraburkholderia sp. WC7.3g]|uniref:SDR family NAD(P)-dependent oxidoreductase n=1 Tax=Paraburkholderia podalyriae TaxID=1938811 RepID=A0ABR7Q1C5_9BURK|nr:oxidoreductase [Paraburkholderia podalyriae]MBC8752356.1 SDR family NAD(P)-dependent oxidoreductase [Paraburkholderia podalyriae]
MNDRKTWFITGCDKGMGYAFAEVILADGDRVVVTARDVANIKPLLDQYPQTAFGYTLDITNAARIREVVADAERATGGVDVVVNNAGYGVLGPAETTTPEEYRPMFEVNFFGMAEVTRAFLPYMRQRTRGHIMNTSSSGGFAASPGFGFYAASKFAVEGFSESVSLDVAALGIKVTILEPGSFRTDFAGGSLVKPKAEIGDYAKTAVSSTLDRMTARHGTQPNDPRRLAKVLIKLARMENPPLRMPLGQDAIDRLRQKLDSVSAEFDKYEDLCLAVAFDSDCKLD